MTHFEPANITSSVHKSDPYPLYRRLRENAPVCRVQLPRRQEAWLVTRYTDVCALLRDARLVKDPANALTPEALKAQPRPPSFLTPLTRNMLGLDDPDHARLKRLVQKAFTTRRVEQLATRTQAVTDALVSRLPHSGGPFDLIRDYALPLPVTVISDLLGVPEADRTRFAGWSRILITTPQTPFRMLLAVPQLFAFVSYLRRLVALKRKSPKDDLVSELVQIEADGEGLTGEELLAMVAILLSAGHETTTNLIGNGILALLRQPDQAALLREQPELMENAVEELLRFESPAETTTHRYAREEIEIAGVRIPRGALVLGVIASANRDATQFPEPDRLDVTRTPNRHLSFGLGGHFCVGSALARMEGRVAIATLLRRLPALRLARPLDAADWRAGMVLRGLKRLPLSCAPV